MDIVSRNVTNTIVTNVISTVSINHDNKKLRCKINYILLAFLLVIIVILIITFICHYYTNKSKQNHVGTLTI